MRAAALRQSREERYVFRPWGGLALAGAAASLVLFAASTWYSLSLGLVFVAGLAQAVVWTVIATLILSHTAQPMRGRVMGLRAGVVVSLPVGNLLAGAAAERFGAALAQGAYGACAIIVMAAIVALAPELRRLD